jgi:hypothetical protein
MFYSHVVVEDHVSAEVQALIGPLAIHTMTDERMYNII